MDCGRAACPDNPSAVPSVTFPSAKRLIGRAHRKHCDVGEGFDEHKPNEPRLALATVLLTVTLWFESALLLGFPAERAPTAVAKAAVRGSGVQVAPPELQPIDLSERISPIRLSQPPTLTLPPIAAPEANHAAAVIERDRSEGK